MRQMVFDIPDEVAESFSRDVPAEQRSGMIAEFMVTRSPRRLSEAEWEASAKAVNDDPGMQHLEQAWACTLGDGLDQEPGEW